MPRRTTKVTGRRPKTSDLHKPRGPALRLTALFCPSSWLELNLTVFDWQLKQLMQCCEILCAIQIEWVFANHN